MDRHSRLVYIQTTSRGGLRQVGAQSQTQSRPVWTGAPRGGGPQAPHVQRLPSIEKPLKPAKCQAKNFCTLFVRRCAPRGSRGTQGDRPDYRPPNQYTWNSRVTFVQQDRRTIAARDVLVPPLCSVYVCTTTNGLIVSFLLRWIQDYVCGKRPA